MACNSLGQCVAAADGGGGGCCDAGGGASPLGAVGLGALVAVLATRRRRGAR
jgi:MYXO-CTERM domain-containing protein